MEHIPDSPTFETLQVSILNDGLVWEILIDRPAARNAVDRGTAHALANTFRAFEEDRTARVAILGGSGGHFCAGADLKAVAQGTPNDVYPVGDAEGPMGPTRMSLTKPVIAAINGSCVAGGLELACWADLRVVGHSTQMGVLCRRWGVPLIDGGTVRLPRLVGQSHAMDLILTGRMIDGDEAYRIGLANRVVEDGWVSHEARKLANAIAQFPQRCMRNDRRSVYESAGLAENDALATEYEYGADSMKEAVAGASKFARGEGRHGRKQEPVDQDPFTPTCADSYSVVLFDLGGVLLESPFRAISKFETQHNLESFSIARVISGSGEEGSFAKLERGEIDSNGFEHEFSVECEKFGLGRVDGRELLQAITSSLRRRPLMEHAIDILRKEGYKTGIITNNYKIADEKDRTRVEKLMSQLRRQMDVVTESCVLGQKKPHSSIFEVTIDELKVPPTKAVYLDDIGANLKPAMALGMKTIKVSQTDYGGIGALGNLERTLGISLLSRTIQLATRRVPRL
eukprot:gb/GECG01002285.1/.p1 GENE.gb/GECG01002285.1/~~gb/GECG01002285.1/.p1  ORF type:complete len:513 (+),score=51.44 gb/GECG01002285.1/:1-1539(+)